MRARNAALASGQSKKAAKKIASASAIRRTYTSSGKVLGLSKPETREFGRSAMAMTRKFPGAAKKVKK